MKDNNKKQNADAESSILHNDERMQPLVTNPESEKDAPSGLHDGACSFSSIPCGTDLSNVAEENSKACDELLAASQFLVDAGENVVPLESSEKGIPVSRANPLPSVAAHPYGDNGSSQPRVVGAILQSVDESTLVGGGLVSEIRIEGNNDKVDPLLSDVGDFVFGHGVIDSSNFQTNVKEHATPLAGASVETGGEA